MKALILLLVCVAMSNAPRAWAGIPEGDASYTESWLFKYKYQYNRVEWAGSWQQPAPVVYGDVSNSIRNNMICDQSPEFVQVGDAISCFYYDGRTIFRGRKVLGKNPKILVLPSGDLDVDALTLEGGIDGEVEVTEGLGFDFVNQLHAVTPEHPISMVHDIQHGRWHVEMK